MTCCGKQMEELGSNPDTYGFTSDIVIYLYKFDVDHFFISPVSLIPPNFYSTFLNLGNTVIIIVIWVSVSVDFFFLSVWASFKLGNFCLGIRHYKYL